MSVEVAIQNHPRAVATAHPQLVSPIRTGIPRFIEIVVAVAGLVVFAPLLALAAAAVTLTSRGGIIFRQQRMGRGGQTFTLYKLRTMRLTHEETQVTAGDDVRITSLGKFLRKTKLDEIPQLWNVLKGN